jgi:hypothetical protein
MMTLLMTWAKERLNDSVRTALRGQNMILVVIKRGQTARYIYNPDIHTFTYRRLAHQAQPRFFTT